MGPRARARSDLAVLACSGHTADEPDATAACAVADALRDRLSATFRQTTFDALVNNAGVGLNKPYVETTPDDFDAMIDIQLKTPFFLTQRLLPMLSDGGQVLNVSSGLARFVGPGNSLYAAAKGAIEVLTRYQAQELAARQIRVHTLRPGAIATDFGGGAVRDNPQYHQAVLSMIALGRPARPTTSAPGWPRSSDDLGWADGTVIELSGGQRL